MGPDPEFEPGLPRNFLRPCVLLLVGEEPSHGYDLVVRLAALGFPNIDPGGLYRSLRAMEQEGLLRSTWEDSDAGPPRRTYRLTAEGRDWLHAWGGTLRRTEQVVAEFVSRYETFATERAARR